MKFSTVILYISGGEPMARLPEVALTALSMGAWARAPSLQNRGRFQKGRSTRGQAAPTGTAT